MRWWLGVFQSQRRHFKHINRFTNANNWKLQLQICYQFCCSYPFRLGTKFWATCMVKSKVATLVLIWFDLVRYQIKLVFFCDIEFNWIKLFQMISMQSSGMGRIVKIWIVNVHPCKAHLRHIDTLIIIIMMNWMGIFSSHLRFFFILLFFLFYIHIVCVLKWTRMFHSFSWSWIWWIFYHNNGNGWMPLLEIIV